MLFGNSILHVKQKEGKFYSRESIKGYYNDMTEKVLKGKKLQIGEFPLVVTENGENILFPTAIFQYGLGAFDLYIELGNLFYYDLFISMADWAVDHKNQNGAWDNFSFIYPKNPYSAMAQGEGASLLLRAYSVTNNDIYYKAALDAIDFMLEPLEQGGTSLYVGDKLYFMEYTQKSVVLNGWIFAIFGLIDLCKISDDNKYTLKLNQTLITLQNVISDFDASYWSYYNQDKSVISSRFYHDLHIALLRVLYNLSNISKFEEVSRNWYLYAQKSKNRIKAFLIKVIQKVKE